jgi:hypothetical protein
MPPAVSDVSSLRDVLLQRAGLDLERQASLLRQAVGVFEAGLSAQSAMAPDLPDWFARLKAARGLVDIVGIMPSRTQSAKGVPQVVVNIEVPDWAQPMMARRGLGREIHISRPAGETDPA